MKNIHLLTKLSIIVLIISIFSGCGEPKRADYGLIYFDSKFPKGNKNLQNILGNSFMAKRMQDVVEITSEGVAIDSVAYSSSDSIPFQLAEVDSDPAASKGIEEYIVNYDKATELNTIIRKATNDTLLHGWISKFRGLYYVSEPVNDTTFRLFAFKIEKNIIKGLLGSGWQDYNLLLKIDSGYYKNIVKYRQQKDSSSYFYKLKNDKYTLRNFYEHETTDAPGLEIVEEKEPELPRTITQKNTVPKPPTQTKTDLKISVYPNPSVSTCTVSFNATASYKLEFFNLQQRLIRSMRQRGDSFSVDVSGLEEGVYFIVATNTETGLRSTTKLMVEH